MVKDLNSVGSKITMDDMKSYKATELKALESELPGVKGYKILTVPPPAGGVALINILNILKGQFLCFFLTFFAITRLPFFFRLWLINWNLDL